MKLVTVLLLFVGAMSAGASTHGDLVIFRSVDVGRTLPGSAYLMSVGPGLEADVPMKIDGLESTGTVKGHRFLRVTLFRVERSYSIWVEEIFINRAGGTV